MLSSTPYIPDDDTFRCNPKSSTSPCPLAPGGPPRRHRRSHIFIKSDKSRFAQWRLGVSLGAAISHLSPPLGARPDGNEARHRHDGRPGIKLTSESWRLHKWPCGVPYITFITAIFIFIFHICIFCAVINQGVYG